MKGFLLTIIYFSTLLSVWAQGLTESFLRDKAIVISSTPAERFDLRMNSFYFNSDASAKIPGERMRNTGAFLTAGGLILSITGITILSNVDGFSFGAGSFSYQSNNPNDDGELPDEVELGLLATIGGVGMMVPGIIFWSKGSKKYNTYKQEQNLSLRISGDKLSLQLKL